MLSQFSLRIPAAAKRIGLVGGLGYFVTVSFNVPPYVYD